MLRNKLSTKWCLIEDSITYRKIINLKKKQKKLNFNQKNKKKIKNSKKSQYSLSTSKYPRTYSLLIHSGTRTQHALSQNTQHLSTARMKFSHEIQLLTWLDKI